MKHRKIKILLSVLFLLCTLMCSMNVLAADDRLGEVVDGSLLTDDSESEGITQSLLRGAFLNYGSGAISNPSGKKVSISGQTVCYRTCDKVKVTLHLQRLVGNTWSTLYTLGTKTATNTYFVSNSNSYTVTGGYYYRVYGSHIAFDGDDSEATASFTNGIWIE